MNPNEKRRLKAMTGVILLLLLFVLTIVFLLSGNIPMAITMVAINGLVLFILYFTLRINNNVEEMNPELFPDDTDDDTDSKE